MLHQELQELWTRTRKTVLFVTHNVREAAVLAITILTAARELNDIAQVMAVMLVIVGLGLLVDHLIFARLERRIRRMWGLPAG